MKWLKKVLGATMATAIALSVSISAFATQPETRNMANEPVDRSGQVTRVDIPNGDGTFTSLEGDEAQQWYNKAVAEGKQRMAEESAMQAVGENEIEIETRGPFHYKYRYLESNHTNDVERTELEKTVTNKLRNTSSTQQTYTLNLSVSQSWSISPSVTGSYEDAIKATLGSSWGKTYSKSEVLSVNVEPHKTVWVTFVPIMDKSVGKAQKYYIPRGGLSKDPFVEKSYDVTTYNPKYLTSKIGPFTIKTVYGVYVWHEQ